MVCLFLTSIYFFLIKRESLLKENQPLVLVMKKSKEMKVLSQKITLQIFSALYLQRTIKDTKDI